MQGMNLFQFRNHLGNISEWDSFFDPSPTAEPTAAQPGSADKVRILAERMERGEELWHPGDRTDHSGYYGHPNGGERGRV